MRRLLWLGVFALTACTQKAEAPKAVDAGPKQEGPRAEIVYRSHKAMGTQITITAFTSEPKKAEAAFQKTFAEFDRLERLLTVWRPDSDVSRINQAAGKEAVKVDPETISVVQRALELARLTDGKFDVTFGALSGLWKFDHDQDDRIPAAKDVQARLPFVRWEGIKVNAEENTVMLDKKGMKLHLGGIGKGWAVDKAVVIMRKAGLRDFMVQAGGDLYVAGTRGSRAWRVGVRDPRGSRSSYFAFAEVTDATFSTSGDYERYFEKDGRRYHHILDPDSGQPAKGIRSVTVMAPDATTADALSTGLFILGLERGMEVIESVEGAGAVFVTDKNEVRVSKRLKDNLRIVDQPTP